MYPNNRVALLLYGSLKLLVAVYVLAIRSCWLPPSVSYLGIFLMRGHGREGSPLLCGHQNTLLREIGPDCSDGRSQRLLPPTGELHLPGYRNGLTLLPLAGSGSDRCAVLPRAFRSPGSRWCDH